MSSSTPNSSDGNAERNPESITLPESTTLVITVTDIAKIFDVYYQNVYFRSYGNCLRYGGPHWRTIFPNYFVNEISMNYFKQIINSLSNIFEVPQTLPIDGLTLTPDNIREIDTEVRRIYNEYNSAGRVPDVKNTASLKSHASMSSTVHRLSTTPSILTQSHRILQRAAPTEIDSMLRTFPRGASISTAERILYSMDRTQPMRRPQSFSGTGRTLSSSSSSTSSSVNSSIPDITDEEHSESLRKLRMKYFDS
jgi:hypothetical protein